MAVADITITALKITAGHWSLSIVTAFMTAVKHHSTITMTANTYI